MVVVVVVVVVAVVARIPSVEPDIAYQVSIERDDVEHRVVCGVSSVAAGAHAVNVLRFVSEQSFASLSCLVGFKRFRSHLH